MNKLYGLIPAAGKGTRAYPYTRNLHKGMLEINGEPNLQRIIRLMRDELHIRDICIVIGHLGDSIKSYFGDDAQLNVNLRYIENTELDKGLAYSVLLSKAYIDDYFCVMLCDECYISSNHHALRSAPYRSAIATCAALHVDETELIKRNYAVYTDGEFISRLVEKPRQVDNDFLGVGTFVFSPSLYDHLEKAFAESANGYVEFVTLVDQLIQAGHPVRCFELSGTYVNINDRDSIHLAKYHDRAAHFGEYEITLLIYSEGDEKNIAFTLQRYKEINKVHHMFVVLPDDNTIEEIITKNEVGVIKCPAGMKFYGEKLKYAMTQAPGDILILAEADYSFASRDITKLLIYLQEADMVIGTRTTRQLIEQGSNMRGIVRIANVLLAKLIELWWWRKESRFTDVGCTLRAIWKSSFEAIADNLKSKGPEFSAEMMIDLVQQRKQIIEIPVNYFNRSQSLQRAYQQPRTFVHFVCLICKKRWQHLVGGRASN